MNSVTPCQKMAIEALSEHTPHYHGIINLKEEDSILHLDRYHGREGFFMKKFLINDKFNQNDWKVTWEGIKADVFDFIGKPLVLTPDKNHPPVSIQDDYRVGEIIDVGLDEINHVAWQVSEIYDKKAQDMILNKEIEFGSPTVLVRSESTREQKFKGTPQQQDILHRFKPAHDALVGDPAYGKQVDNIPAVCTGDGPACALKLLEVSASVQYRKFHADLIKNSPHEYKCDNGACSACGLPKDDPIHQGKYADVNSDNESQLTIVPFVRKMLKQRFTAENLKEIVTNIKAGSSDSCISRQIKIIADEHPSMAHDQVIAIAYSYCSSTAKEAALEDIIIPELSNDLITLSRDKKEHLESCILDLEKKMKN